MNIFGLLMLFAVGIAAIFGIIMIGANHSDAPVDTYGNTTSEDTNQSRNISGNLTATGTQVGTGAVVLIAGIIIVVVILGLIFIAKKPF